MPAASICKFAFEAAVVILLSVIVIPPSMSKEPVTFAPPCCTLNASAIPPATVKVWKINSFAVPLVPSNKMFAPAVPAEPTKLIPGTLALSVL